MYSIERKSQIINILEQSGKVDVNTLSDKFKISKETIRRDLRALENEGILKRTHGGAVLVNNLDKINEYPVTIREIQRFNEKDQICKKAASFINDGDTIFVDNSSTINYLIKHIPANLRVTIITNSLKLLFDSSQIHNPNLLFVCTGGIINPNNLSVYGNIALKNAGEFYPNKVFLSCTGISPHYELTDSSMYEVDTKRLMIQRSQEVFILADSSKFEKVGQIFLCNFSSVNYIITDSGIKRDNLKYLENTGVNLIITD